MFDPVRAQLKAPYTDAGLGQVGGGRLSDIDATQLGEQQVACRNVTEVRRSLAFPSVRAERSRNICSISVSLEVPRAARIDEKTFLENFAAILRSLPALKELSILGYDTPHIPSRDIFRGCTFNLEKLHCDSNKLLAASWNSVGQSSIRDFRGFTNFVTEGPPSEIQPRNMVNLKHLETSAYFAERLTTPAKITHISLHTSRSKTKDTLWYLSNLLGDQLVSLRVNRTLVASKSPPLEDVEKADTNGLLWASDSPLMISCMLRAPNLTYLEIRDTSLKKWSALQRLVWRPPWAKRVRQLHAITTEHIRDCFSLLPVNFVAIPVEASDLGMWRVSLRGRSPEEIEDYWPPCAIREDSWRI